MLTSITTNNDGPSDSIATASAPPTFLYPQPPLDDGTVAVQLSNMTPAELQLLYYELDASHEWHDATTAAFAASGDTLGSLMELFKGSEDPVITAEAV